MSKLTTKIAISYAFKELLLEKPLNKIKVNDITEKCEINRQTFYYHFHDVVELLEWICEIVAENALKENRTYDTWQEGFLSVFEVIKKDKPFVTNIYRYASREYLHKYLYRVTYQLLYNVLNEKAHGMIVREEDKQFIGNFYKYGFVGLVIEWIEQDMREDPRVIVERLNSLIEGTFEHALENAKLNK